MDLRFDKGHAVETVERIAGRLSPAISFHKRKGVIHMNGTDVKKSETDQPDKETAGKGKAPGLSGKMVGPLGVTLLIVYLVALSLLAIYGLIQFLPDTAAGASQATGTSAVSFLFWGIEMNPEVRLFITVALAGLLGSLVHALRSLYWYVGNRNLNRSWIAKYVLMPFVGTVLGLAFYLVIRGGFFSAGAKVDQTNPYGFTALAVLIGMFSEQAALKLKSVAETLLSKPPKGSNPSPQEESEKPPKPESEDDKT